MDDEALAGLQAVLPPLLRALDALERVARFFDPPAYGALLSAIGEPEAPLEAALAGLGAWPQALAPVRAAVEAAASASLAGLRGLRAAGELADVFRALGQLPRAQEALYPLAEGLAPVSRYFLEPAARGDGAKVAALARGAAAGVGGVVHFGNERTMRGGWSVYVPEDLVPEGRAQGEAAPLVVALHGGSGHGRAFLWTWLRAARTHGAVLVAATSVGPTWALDGPDPDASSLAAMLEAVEARWPTDPARRLLTGMSDGGTFTYLAGLTTGLPFTHLAPVAAAFHPMLAGFADAGRLQGLPVHIVHGTQDWMFPVESAREAAAALRAAGADAAYSELADLGHAYPREINGPILAWMGVRPRRNPPGG